MIGQCTCGRGMDQFCELSIPASAGGPYSPILPDCPAEEKYGPAARGGTLLFFPRKNRGKKALFCASQGRSEGERR